MYKDIVNKKLHGMCFVIKIYTGYRVCKMYKALRIYINNYYIYITYNKRKKTYSVSWMSSKYAKKHKVKKFKEPHHVVNYIKTFGQIQKGT